MSQSNIKEKEYEKKGYCVVDSTMHDGHNDTGSFHGGRAGHGVRYQCQLLYNRRKMAESSLAGYNDGKTNYNVGGGSCTWQPELLFGGKYQLSIWNVQNAASVDTVTVEISDKNGVTTVTYKQRTGENGFVDLGQYEFDAGSAGYVKVIIDGEAVGSQFTRQSAVRYELVERGEGYQSLVPATGTETYEDYAMRSIPQKDVSIPETRDNAVKIYVQNGASGDGS